MKTPSLTVLDNVEIATPCTARWEEMAGDDRSRHCSHCDLNVYNVSAMTRDEANTLIAGAEGRLCIRLYRRTDGTLLTQDCPTGLRAARQRVVRSVRNVAATVVTLVAGMIGFGASGASAQPRAKMGRVAVNRSEPANDWKMGDTVIAKQEPMKVDTAQKCVVMGQMIAPPDTARQSTPPPDTVEDEPMYLMGEVAFTPDPEPLSQPADLPAPDEPSLPDAVSGEPVSPVDTISNEPSSPADAVPVAPSLPDAVPVAGGRPRIR